jgi:hypothetical protein
VPKAIGIDLDNLPVVKSTLTKDNQEFIISQIYYILCVRSTSKETVNEILFKDDLRIDWELINNEQFD